MAKHFKELYEKECELAKIDYVSIYNSLSINGKSDPNIYCNVDSVPILKRLHSKYPFFNKEISIFKIDGTKCSDNNWPIHVDAGRKSALNIPIINCNLNAVTCFYEEPTPFQNKFIPIQQYHISLITGDLKIVDSFSLVMPTLINTAIPHSVINNGEGSRVIMSWGSMLGFNELVNKIIGN